MVFYIFAIIFFIPIILLFPTKVVGRQNLKKISGRMIIASNHQIWADPFIISAALRARCFYVAKETLFKSRIMAAFYRGMGCIPVKPNEINLTSMKKINKVLKDEKKLLIFSQGRRKKRAEDLDGLKNGTILFAIKNKSPIIPTILLKRPRLLILNQILVGEPIILEDFFDKKTTKEILDEGSARLAQSLKNLREEHILRILKKKYRLN